MKKYRVQVEIKVVSIDFAYIECEAASRAQALQKAKQAYNAGEVSMIDMCASGTEERSLNINTIQDWKVKEIT